MERIDSVMKMKPLDEPSVLKHPSDNSVTLSDVSFRYKDAKENALNHISLNIHPGACCVCWPVRWRENNTCKPDCQVLGCRQWGNLGR